MPPGRRPLSACPPASRASTPFCEEAFSKQAFTLCGASRERARRSSETSSASIMPPPGIMRSTSPFLAETHDRMMQHMQTMAFFEPACIPDCLYYVNGFRVLEEDGIKGFIDLLRREIRTHDATLLVLDGLIATEESSESDIEFKKFVLELQAHMAIEGCTALLLTNGRRNEYHPEYTMVDGLIELHDVLFGTQAERELEVRKLRGTDALRGRHSFRITDRGIVAYPRIEALLARPSAADQWPDERCVTGVNQLDAMLGGGIPRSTATLVLGASGSGKTSLGLHFL